MILDNKTILITGGCGSFGQKFIELVLKEHNPKSIRIYDNRELAMVEVERKFNDPRLRFLIGDVRDLNRLGGAMHGVDIVVHAAALKHVPICEYNPIEAIRTNIDGAINVIDVAIHNSVEKIIAISTDKAVQPVNLYGATKMVAEKLFVQANAYSGGRKTIFSCARYGNVMGSSGSVVPLFKEQKGKGEITITDERMTRFWITLDEGVRFVINSLEKMKGGEIFVPKIPSMKISDVAEAVAPGVSKKIIGMRPGEKLHEVLLTAEESRHVKEFNDYYIVEPEFSFWNCDNHKEGKLPCDGFCYSSDNNVKWLEKNKINEL
jgi:UDP-N-acetylglucosamine 4,6-dehydratase/5-epimerase